MITFKKILYLILLICVWQWSLCLVECATTTGVSSSDADNERSDDKTQGVSSSILGSIYRKSRQLRCVTCYEDRRHGDDRSRYYSSYSGRYGDDRASSWYYPSYDRHDDRGYRGAHYDRYGAPATADRYGVDRYGSDRYGAERYGSADRYSGYRDDHYGSGQSYDRYDSRTRVPYERLPVYDRGESRGYGYDNRDRYYGSDRDYYGRDRYYERPRYGTSSGAGSTAGYGSYDRDYYDRYSPRYDYRQRRPWDDTYRGQSGYYDGKGSQEDRRYLPESAYNSPCAARRPNCPYNPAEEGTRVTSDPINSGHYNVGVSQSTYHTNPNTNQNESTRGSGSPAGWSYMREDDQASRDGGSGSKTNNNRDKNSDKQSSGYGALLDRGSNLIAVEPAKSSENAMETDTQRVENIEETPKQSDNEQNS